MIYINVYIYWYESRHHLDSLLGAVRSPRGILCSSSNFSSVSQQCGTRAYRVQFPRYSDVQQHQLQELRRHVSVQRRNRDVSPGPCTRCPPHESPIWRKTSSLGLPALGNVIQQWRIGGGTMYLTPYWVRYIQKCNAGTTPRKALFVRVLWF